MEQSINSFLDNENLTIHISLTHLLDFDDDYSDLTNSIKPSMYYSEEDFMSELNPKSCTIMSLNCQSLHAKFTQIKILLDTFAANDTPIQVLCLQETWFENSNQITLKTITLSLKLKIDTQVLMVVLHSIFITTGTIRLNQIRMTLHIGKSSLFKSLTLLIPNLNLMLLIFTDHPMPQRAT